MEQASVVLEKWLESRPQVIKDLAVKYPPGTQIDGRYLVSYNEDGTLGMSWFNPAVDYDMAVLTSHRHVVA